MHIQAQILEEMKQIENDDLALNKLLTYLRNLVKSRNDANAVNDSIVRGLKEVKLSQQGKIQLNTLENLINELDH